MSKFEFLKVAFTRPGRLSEEEELELVKKFQQGDMQAMRRLRISLRDLIEKAIRDASPSDRSLDTTLRLKAEAKLPGLLQDFNVNRNVKLNTFLLSNLKGHLRNTVAENQSGAYVPRNMATDLNKFRQAKHEAEMEFGKNPTDEQIRQFYPNDATESYDRIKQYYVQNYSADAKFGENEDGDGVSFRDQFSTGATITRDDLMRSLYEDEQDRFIKANFTPQEQEVIRKVVKEGQSFVQAALSLGISTSEVRSTIRKWHEKTATK